MNTASRHHGDTERAQHIDHSTTHGAFSIPVQGEVGTVSAGDRRLGPDLGLVRLTARGGCGAEEAVSLQILNPPLG